MRPLIVGAACAVTVAGLSIDAHALQATFKHRQGGIVHGVHVKSDGVTAWAVEDGARIRKTTDGFDTWTFQTTPDAARAQLLGVFFLADGSTGWAVGEKSTILKTTDGGSTWTLANSANYPTDHGDWLDKTDLWDVHFIDGSLGWVSGREGVIWKSTDGGANWTTQHTNLYDEFGVNLAGHDTFSDRYALHFVTEASGTTHGYLTGDWGWTFHTTDAGATWNLLTTPGMSKTGPNIEVYDIEVNRFGNGYAVGGVGTSCGRAYRIESWSTVTWHALGTSNPSPVGSPSSCSGDQDCSYTPSCTGFFACKDGTTLYGLGTLTDGRAVGGGYAAHAWRAPSTPSTALWTNVSPVLPSTLPVKPPLFGTAVVGVKGYTVGQFNAIRRSNDLDQTCPTWVNKAGTTSTRLHDGDWIDASTGWFCGQDFRIYRSDDAGVTHCLQVDDIALTGGALKNVRGIAAWDSNKAVAVGDAYTSGGSTVPYVRYTTNGGGTCPTPSGWNAPSSLPTFSSVPHLLDVQFRSSTDLWACGTAGAVIKSTDGGVNWSDGDPSDTIAASVILNGICFTNATRGFAVGLNPSGAPAFKYDSSTQTWSTLTVLRSDGSGGFVNYTGELFALALSSATAGYAVGNEGRVFSFDGTTFQEVYQTSSELDLFSVELVPSSSVVYAGGEYGVLAKYDGTSWTEPKSNTSMAIEALTFLSTTSGFLTGRTFGVLRFE